MVQELHLWNPCVVLENSSFKKFKITPLPPLSLSFSPYIYIYIYIKSSCVDSMESFEFLLSYPPIVHPSWQVFKTASPVLQCLHRTDVFVLTSSAMLSQYYSSLLVCEMRGKWPCSCFMAYCFQDLFKTARTILV